MGTKNQQQNLRGEGIILVGVTPSFLIPRDKGRFFTRTPNSVRFT